MTRDPRRSENIAFAIAVLWKSAFPIICFLVGASLLIYDGIIDPPSDATTSGIGLVLAGLGPAGLIDVIRKIP